MVKCEIFILSAFLATAMIQAAAPDIGILTKSIYCFQKAARFGNKELDIPSFTPYVQTFDVHIPILKYPLATFILTLNHIKWTEIPNFSYNFQQKSDNTDQITIAFQINWPKIEYVGKWLKDLQVLKRRSKFGGELSMVFNEISLTGNISLTSTKVTSLKIKSHLNGIKVNIKNIGPTSNSFNIFLETLCKRIFNSDDFGYVAAGFFEEQINTGWLGQPQRMRTLNENCFN